MNKKLTNIFMLSSTLLLAACGGGGGGSDATPTPASSSSSSSSVSTVDTVEGYWTGTTSDLRTVYGLMLNDKTFWVLYSLPNNSQIIAGGVQGNYNASNGTLTSSNSKDYNFEGAGVSSNTVSATYTPKQKLNGTIAFRTMTSTFTSQYNADYEKTATLASIVGNYTGKSSASATEVLTLNLASTGALTGSGTSGCSFSGTVSPRSKGNVYDVSAKFNGSPCAAGYGSVSGIIYYDAASKRLYSAMLDSGRSSGFIFLGTKQ